MAKSPIAGRVKRRLAREVGTTQAVHFYRTCLAHTLLRLSSDRRWVTYVAITPGTDTDSQIWRRLAPQGRRLGQGGRDLGQRMQCLFRLAPRGPAIIIGSDIASISASEIARAFRLLGKTDAVFGPATDGGYWLVGLKRRPRLLSPFASVRWSSDQALTDTLANLAGRNVAFVATLDDVDNEAAYRSTRHQWRRLVPPRRAF